MGEWRECKLGDLIQSISETYKFTDEKVVFLNTSDVYLGSIINKNKFEPSALPGQAKKKIKKDDLLFSEIRPANGRYALVKENVENYVVSTKLMVLRSKGDILPEYLNIFLTSKDMLEYLQMLAEDRSGTFPQITFNHISSIDISLPLLKEQKAIADVLSSLDDKIYLLQRQNCTLESLAQTLFRQWFIEEADEGWEEVLITDLFEVRDGTHDSPKQKEIGKPLITTKHMSNNKLDIENAYLISEDDFEKVNRRSVVEQYDILFSMIGTIGLVFLEQSEKIDYAIKNIGLFKTSQNKDYMYFLYLWLKSSYGNEFIHENRSGSTQEYISLTSLRNIIFYIPNKQTIINFNEKVNPLFEKINANQQQIQTLEKLRDTLLPKLMSGEVRVKYE